MDLKAKPKLILVMFARKSNPQTEIIGMIQRDRNEPSPQDRTKIVFIDGFRGDVQNWMLIWKRELPQDGEYWWCEEAFDTNTNDPRRGALIVRQIELAGEPDEERLHILLQHAPSIPAAKLIENLADQIAAAIGPLLGYQVVTHALETYRNNWTEMGHPGEILSHVTGKDITKHGAWQNTKDLKGIRITVLEALKGWLAAGTKPGTQPSADLFTDEGKRWYRCSCCGYWTRLGKTVYRQYLDGAQTEHMCPNCGVNWWLPPREPSESDVADQNIGIASAFDKTEHTLTLPS